MNNTAFYPVFKLLIPFIAGIVLWWVIDDFFGNSNLLTYFTLLPFFYYYYQAKVLHNWTRPFPVIFFPLSRLFGWVIS